MRVSDSTARRLGEMPDDLTIGERWEAHQAARAIERERKAARA